MRVFTVEEINEVELFVEHHLLGGLFGVTTSMAFLHVQKLLQRCDLVSSLFFLDIRVFQSVLGIEEPRVNVVRSFESLAHHEDFSGLRSG